MSTIKFCLILVFALISSTQVCDADYSLQGIETGIVSFQNTVDGEASRKFVYSYFSRLENMPQVALAINNIQNSFISHWSFYIAVTQIGKTSVEFTLNTFQQWKLFTINFMIVSRDDLYVGYTQLIFQGIDHNSVQIATQKQIKYEKSVAKVFLNGILLKQSQNSHESSAVQRLDVKIEVDALTSDFILLSVSGSTAKQIKSIWVSYVVFQPQSARFASYGGIIRQNGLKGISSINLHKILYKSQYKLYGINGIQVQANSLGLITNIGSDFITTIYSSNQIDELVLSYVILGNQPSKMCNCSDRNLTFAYQNSCLSQCPQNTIVNLYFGGGGSCLECSASLNLKINADKTGCQCNQGYEFDDEGQKCILKRPILQNITQDPSPDQNTSSLPPLQASNACLSQLQNSYFDGYKCHCKPGYINVSNACQPSVEWPLQQKIIVPIHLNLSNDSPAGQVYNFSCKQNQVNINGECQCKQNYVRLNGTFCQYNSTQNNITCGYGEYWDGNRCTCLTGYVRTAVNACQQQVNINCTVNQVYNGLGTCVCRAGYFYVNGTCVDQKPCPPNSFRLSNGTCACNLGFYYLNGECSNCLQGQFYLRSENKCVTFCGANSIFNQTLSQCQCISGFGIGKDNTCVYCPSQKVILNNYCVGCPLNMHYDPVSRKCECNPQFYLERNGLCYPKCPNNEYFNFPTQSCRCRLTLGRLNNSCQVCPDNSYAHPVTQKCTYCGANQYYSDGRCICKDQYALTQFGTCVSCGYIENTFMYKGKCATCAGDKIFNGSSCVCPSGTVTVGLKCKKTCRGDQLIDSNGNCYTCPINEAVYNNQCQCQRGYLRINGICQLVCPLGFFIYQGRCATCPANKYFNPKINGCICSEGFYLNNYNQCEQITINYMQCPLSQYLDLEFGCLDCPAFCSRCQSSTKCSACQDKFVLVNGKCVDTCGNGVLTAAEECDDGNLLDRDGCSSSCKVQQNFKCSGTPSFCVYINPVSYCGNGIIQINEECDDMNTASGDGCSSTCAIERMFTCYGQPSVCKYNSTFHACGNGFIEYSEQCDDRNFANGDGCNTSCYVQNGFVCSSQPSVCEQVVVDSLKVYGDIKFNVNNIYLTLQTSQKYNFTSSSVMENFIRASYSTVVQPSTFCLQRDFPDLDLFDCLLIYSTGIPNKAFKAEFTYSTENSTVKLAVDINPLMASQPSKNLRRG